MDTVKKTARSFYQIYKQLPLDVQKEFAKLIREDEDLNAAFWEKLSETTLADVWGKPEDDEWDKVYHKQVQKK